MGLLKWLFKYDFDTAKRALANSGLSTEQKYEILRWSSNKYVRGELRRSGLSLSDRCAITEYHKRLFNDQNDHALVKYRSDMKEILKARMEANYGCSSAVDYKPR